MISLKDIVSNTDKANFPFKNNCFLCNCELNEQNRSKEHVFPKWVIKKFELNKYSLKVTNNSTVKYSQLLVPCCQNCNNEYLSKMETRMKELVNRNFNKLDQTDELTIAQWSAKIILGSLIKETSLPSSQRDTNGRNILHKSWLTDFDIIYAIMQTTRFKHEIFEVKPWSIFAMQFEDETFRYITNIHNKAMSIQLGKTGYMIIYEDSNQVENVWNDVIYVEKMGDLKLGKVTENYMRINLARLIMTKHTITGITQTTYTFNEGNSTIQLKTIEPEQIIIRWTPKDKKLLKQIWKSTYSGEMLEAKEIVIKEVQEPKNS